MILLLAGEFSPVATAETFTTQEFGPGDQPRQGDEGGESSPVALVVILLLALATALLIRSMTKRIRKLPETFEDRDEHGRIQEPETNGASSKD